MIEFSGAPSGGVGQTHSPGTKQHSSTSDRMQWKLRKLRRDKQVRKGEFLNGWRLDFPQPAHLLMGNGVKRRLADGCGGC